MQIIKAEAMGMCFGVKRALDRLDQINNPTQVTIFDDLVHNEQVLDRLQQRGFRMLSEDRREYVPSTPEVLITAHGVSNKECEKLDKAGKQLIDTTCPLVRRVHEAALALQQEGRHVVVIGKPGHIEVRGIVGDLDRYSIVENIDDVSPIDASKIGVVCQTTTPPDKAHSILHAIREANQGKSIRFIDTICRPTRQRQEAVRHLITQIDALIVVGGKRSNNTRQLAKLAESHGIPAFCVVSEDDLNAYRLFSYEIIGLTAGTSTPDETIERVYHKLLSIRDMKKRCLIQSA